MLEGRATVLNQLDFLLKLTASVGTGQGVNAGFNFDVLCSYSGSSSRVMDMTEGDPTPFLWRHLAMQQVSCLTASPNIRQFRQFFNFRHHASQFCFASTLPQQQSLPGPPVRHNLSDPQCHLLQPRQRRAWKRRCWTASQYSCHLYHNSLVPGTKYSCLRNLSQKDKIS